MPTTFNFPVVYDTLDVDGDDFLVTLHDGTWTRPVCAFLDPANEPNEGHTVTLTGHFGGREEGQWPTSIEVVSDDLKLWDNIQKKQISAKGLKLERETGGASWGGFTTSSTTQYGHSMSYESGLLMLQAWAYPFTEKGEGTQIENHCRIDFPLTTHVIKVLFNGGFTKDGIHPLLPSDTSLFTVYLPRGKTLLWNRFIGLADLGTDEMWKTWPEIYDTDGDNYLDLCLQLTESDNIEDIQTVGLQAEAVFPPRGTGSNVAHRVKVQHLPSGQFPYEREITTLAYKLALIYAVEVIDTLLIAFSATFAIVGLPVIGFAAGLVTLFVQAYLPSIFM